MDRRSVVLLTTGGTVATTFDAVARHSQPALAATDLRDFATVPDVELDAREIFRVASWTLDPPAMAGIAAAARDAARNPSVRGVVVAHGTSTLEYTAFLTDLLLDPGSPVVFTGAMLRADHPTPDGPGNLRDAVRVAASDDARDLGALVVLDGRIMSARSVWKARKVGRDAFVDLDGDVGIVSSSSVIIGRRPGRRAALSGPLATDVAFVKAVPGADGRMIDAAIEGGALGLVVEGLPGIGGIPPAMQPAILAAARKVPVVIASRAPYGRLPAEPTGGTGEPLVGGGLLSAGGLTAEQAWLLLMVVLGEHPDRQAAQSVFTRMSGATRVAS